MKIRALTSTAGFRRFTPSCVPNTEAFQISSQTHPNTSILVSCATNKLRTKTQPVYLLVFARCYFNNQQCLTHQPCLYVTWSAIMDLCYFEYNIKFIEYVVVLQDWDVR